MGKSTSDTLRDLLGGLTDDLKEAFDDIIDYDEHGRRRAGRGRGRDRGRDNHWRQREDDGRWHDRDHDHSRGRGGGSRSVEDDGYDHRDRPRRPAAAADFPRQSGRGERAEQKDLKETVQALRSELSFFVEALRETSAARASVRGQESRRT